MKTIALIGNPNSGKTTLFNALTGSNQHVGNWPGVTVEKKEGKFTYNKIKYNVVDLPGTYSLGAYSEDEVVARDYVLHGDPDIVVNVVDATNIERNLYLTTQLLEMGVKVVIALNMMDEALSKDIQINLDKLSNSLGVPVVATVASKSKGLDDLIEKAIEFMDKDKLGTKNFTYGEEIDQELKEIRSLLEDSKLSYPGNWLAIKLLEGDENIFELLEEEGSAPIKAKLASLG